MLLFFVDAATTIGIVKRAPQPRPARRARRSQMPRHRTKSLNSHGLRMIRSLSGSVRITLRLTRAGKRRASDAAASGAAGCYAVRFF